MVKNVVQGNLLVQNNFLNKDDMNKELAKKRVASITQVTVSPVLHTMEDASTTSPTTLEPDQSSTSSGTQTVGIVAAVFAVVTMTAGVSYCCVKRYGKVAVWAGPDTVEDVKRREEEEEELKRNLVEEARKRSEEEETVQKRSEKEEAGLKSTLGE